MTEKTPREACPRCQGYVHFDRDHYGWYGECLRCGHMIYLDTVSDGAPASEGEVA